MAFIDKLLEGGFPYGMEIEQPKALDGINRLIVDNDVQSIVQGLVMGTTGGGGKGLRQLVLALKGKIKGGKMIPSQPIRKGIVGGPKPKSSDFTKEGMLNKDFLKKEYDEMLKTGEIRSSILEDILNKIKGE